MVSHAHKTTSSPHVPPGWRCGPRSLPLASALPPREPAAKEGIEVAPSLLFRRLDHGNGDPGSPVPLLMNPGVRSQNAPVRPSHTVPSARAETESRPLKLPATVLEPALTPSSTGPHSQAMGGRAPGPARGRSRERRERSEHRTRDKAAAVTAFPASSASGQRFPSWFFPPHAPKIALQRQ